MMALLREIAQLIELKILEFLRDVLAAFGLTGENKLCELDPEMLPSFCYPTVNPWITDRHKVCRGCAHWHGLVYGGVQFVCAMHPYGKEDCGDWERQVLEEPVE